MTRETSRCSRWAFVGAVLALAGCGGDGGRITAPPTPTPTPGPVRTSVAQGTTTIPGPDDEFTYFRTVPFSTSLAGTIEATVDWTFPANEVWMYLTSGICAPGQFANPDCPGGPSCTCQFLVESETAVPKPRVLTVPGAAAGTRTLILWNLGPREEALSYQVVLIN